LGTKKQTWQRYPIPVRAKQPTASAGTHVALLSISVAADTSRAPIIAVLAEAKCAGASTDSRDATIPKAIAAAVGPAEGWVRTAFEKSNSKFGVRAPAPNDRIGTVFGEFSAARAPKYAAPSESRKDTRIAKWSGSDIRRVGSVSMKERKVIVADRQMRRDWEMREPKNTRTSPPMSTGIRMYTWLSGASIISSTPSPVVCGNMVAANIALSVEPRRLLSFVPARCSQLSLC
jgi:hypothetical protein